MGHNLTGRGSLHPAYAYIYWYPDQRTLHSSTVDTTVAPALTTSPCQHASAEGDRELLHPNLCMPPPSLLLPEDPLQPPALAVSLVAGAFRIAMQPYVVSTARSTAPETPSSSSTTLPQLFPSAQLLTGSNSLFLLLMHCSCVPFKQPADHSMVSVGTQLDSGAKAGLIVPWVVRTTVHSKGPTI
jgi:hypothetical protein